MSRAYDIVVASVLTILCVVVHLMATELMAPNTVLYGLATEGTANVNGTENAWLWYQIIAIYAPFGSFVGVLAWVLVREYRRAVSTAARDAGRRP